VGFNKRFLGLAAAIAALLGVFAAVISTQSYETLRDGAMDAALGLRRPASQDIAIIVVDIDRPALARIGPWPWSRERLATLAAAIIDAKPRVLGLDILMEGADERSPAALARKLGEATGRPDLAVMASGLVDGDATLAAVLRGGATVLGLALDPDGPGTSPAAPAMLVGGRPDLSGFWNAEGAIGPVAKVADAAAGFGILALPGDGDGRIRHVPLLVSAGGTLRPGLALEMVRIATQAGAYVVDGTSGEVRLGPLEVALPADGMLRLRPGDEERHRTRSVPALEILSGGEGKARLKDAIVLLGTSAPEIGGLRPNASGALVPTVQIQADAIAQLLAGDNPHRTAWMPWLEIGALIVMALTAAWAAVRQTPLTAFAATAGMIVAWTAFVILALDTKQLLFDPVTPPLAAAAAFALAALVTASRTRIREAAIRRRFEQQLPAEVVRRLLDAPDLLKLEGEARRVTALFTDIEGFTAMTERAGPRALVQMLDRYFEGLVRLVVEHGGMVEKIVGDGLHAIFNAPLDLEDHASRAVACALAISAFSDQFRAEGDAARLGFGLTRIGIETGDVILGDVGGGRRLDYTAHGDVMNTASRLEAANKETHSRICIGPVAAAVLDPATIRPLGHLDIRGRSLPLAVFEPWPRGMSVSHREAFRAAVDLIQADPAIAAARLAALAKVYPGDAALARLATATTARLPRQP
jgi:adenylate cyclase